MILDLQNYFSDYANGDQPVAVADNVSAYVIDQQVKNGLFSGPGGAHDEMRLISRCQTDFLSSGGGSIQGVVQDSPDNVTYTDRILGAVMLLTALDAGGDLMNVRLLPSMARYIRVVYRITTAVAQSGKLITFMVKDQDLFDLSQRKTTGTVSAPTGALDESTSNGILGS